MASRPVTISATGQGRGTSGLRRSLPVFSTGGRAPTSSSIGSTNSRIPPKSRMTVALRTKVMRRLPTGSLTAVVPINGCNDAAAAGHTWGMRVRMVDQDRGPQPSPAGADARFEERPRWMRPLTCGNSRPDRPHGDLRPAGHTDCRALALERTRPQKIAGLAMDVEAETEVAVPGRAAAVAHRQQTEPLAVLVPHGEIAD